MTLILMQNEQCKLIFTDEEGPPRIISTEGNGRFTEIQLESLSDFLIIEEAVRRMRHEWTKKAFAPRS